LRAQTQYAAFRVGLFALATLPFVGCQADAPQTGAAEQAVINPPLPSNLNLALNAKTTVTIGPFARAFGDVASSGPTGSLLFDRARRYSTIRGRQRARRRSTTSSERGSARKGTGFRRSQYSQSHPGQRKSTLTEGSNRDLVSLFC
jgi:hypothetical protein